MRRGEGRVLAQLRLDAADIRKVRQVDVELRQRVQRRYEADVGECDAVAEAVRAGGERDGVLVGGEAVSQIPADCNSAQAAERCGTAE